MDWDTINRLVDDNRDFQHFLNDLMEDIKVGKVKSIYDEIYEDEEVAQVKCKEKGILPILYTQRLLRTSLESGYVCR